MKKKVLIEQLEKLTNKKVILKESLEVEINELAEKLVPLRGKAETAEGEMLRAISRVWYRYSNDGDYFYEGYGKETAGPSVDYLISDSPLAEYLSPIFEEMENSKYERADADLYLQGLKKAAKIIVDYVKSKKGNYSPNTTDSR